MGYSTSTLSGQTSHFTTSAISNPTNWQPPIIASGISTNPSSGFQASSVLTAIPTAQAITLLASQIPQFNGLEEDEVDVWIRKIELIASAHGVTDSIKLLAAVSKLSKHARDWFDMDISIVPGSWNSFKVGITRRFRRHIPFNVALQKAETRLWNGGFHGRKVSRNMRWPSSNCYIACNFLRTHASTCLLVVLLTFLLEAPLLL